MPGSIVVKVHVVSAPEAAFLVNSFILEGERSVVVVDTQFLALRRRFGYSPGSLRNGRLMAGQ